MNELFDVLRPAPTKPYRPGSATLIVPQTALDLTLDVLRRAGRLETGCFWYGPKSDADHSRVTAVVVPEQYQTWGNYSVSPEAMRAVYERVSPLELRNLAQVHSHPGDRVEHSTHDDRMANSRRALSIVIPRYGRWSRPWPLGIGVHEFQDDYWYLLPDEAAARRVIMMDDSRVDMIDCRAST